ncbi:helix-turn-helix domain-containing protein [Streptomyces violaceus]|uniref:helix-turn-helix domain-containing protein n=1 Tax=Streptomyces violaceus TaxID=1936 RepID=UPI002E1FF474
MATDARHRLPLATERHERQCRWCRRPLSRYNNEPYCSACSRHVPAAPSPLPQVEPEVWKRLDVREALWARDFGRVCHLVRIGSSLRQSDMAELTGLSQAFLSMLESGVRRLTNIDKIVELLAGLNAPAELTGPMLQPPTAEGQPCGPSLTGRNEGWPA